MDNAKSLDEISIIAALLNDIHLSHGAVFNSRALKLTLRKVSSRTRSEGLSFLTKTLPTLGKAFDKALSDATPLNRAAHRFSTISGSELPRFLGEFFSRVLGPDGRLLPEPCINSVRVLRQVLYCFYKYELGYSDEQEQLVISRFEKTESDISNLSPLFQSLEDAVASCHSTRRKVYKDFSQVNVAREARILLAKLFAFFDPTDIIPRHGPGAVATKQQLWSKFLWTNVSGHITQMYPLDAYFYASLGHVCDRLDSINRISGDDLPARVLLVPKDSRGPRLISCEPVDYQWIQQGLGRAIVELCERHDLTRYNIHFTDQTPNRIGALIGSANGKYATLDLNEASDRVSVGLVRLLFPSYVYTYLEACRSSSTVLPDGRVIKLQKFAPMGSSLCFPVLALTVWAILTAAAPDTDTRESILVYGDDVIVPKAYALNAMEQLESFGLKVNRDKSCISGLFRESCGMDAFKRTDVTPVRLRTVWSSSPSPEVYTSYIAYANSFYDKQFFSTYDKIVEALVAVYGPIPSRDMLLTCPCLREAPESARLLRSRYNKQLQKVEYRVYDVSSPTISKVIDGWSMLLRYFTENKQPNLQSPVEQRKHSISSLDSNGRSAVSLYTKRCTSMLVRRWR
jgi:hypothetical protein